MNSPSIGGFDISWTVPLWGNDISWTVPLGGNDISWIFNFYLKIEHLKVLVQVN